MFWSKQDIWRLNDIWFQWRLNDEWPCWINYTFQDDHIDIIELIDASRSRCAIIDRHCIYSMALQAQYDSILSIILVAASSIAWISLNQRVIKRRKALILLQTTYHSLFSLTQTIMQGYNIHINGLFHCCLRFKQLHSLHEQLKRAHASLCLPQFPPKKLLPLTLNQQETRRAHLERYLQLIGQDPVFSHSELLRQFLLRAQQESSYTESHETTLDVYLMNGYRIQVNGYTTECSSSILEKAARNIDLSGEHLAYFALYLMRTEKDGAVTLVRKLMDFEAPHITQRKLQDCKIVIRKGWVFWCFHMLCAVSFLCWKWFLFRSFFDTVYDRELLNDDIALNILYILTLNDVEREVILATREIREHLDYLQSKGNKKEVGNTTRWLCEDIRIIFQFVLLC